MTDNNQFNELLGKIKEKNSTRTITIWIPSLKKGVDFKHLTLNQQKTLIKSSVRENLLKLDFSRNMFDIIKQNISDNTVKVNQLTTIDLISIGLSYRAVDISDDYGFYVGEEYYPVDLNKICQSVRTTDYGDVFEQDTIVADGFHVKVSVPTIRVDKIMNDHLFEKYKDTPDDPETLRDILADVYIHEAAKYIMSVHMVSEGDNPDEPPVEVPMGGMTAPQRLQVIDQIPLTVLNKLVTISDKVQAIESNLLDIPVGDDVATITLNSAFFT